MHLQVPLSAETESKLRQRAAASGQDVESYVLSAVEAKLLDDADAPEILPPDQWLAAFDAWIRSHASRNSNVDDSRETIYPDRI